MRYSDVFGSCHPAVNFLYFVLVIAFSMCLTHPVCLLLSVCGAVIYHAVLLGPRSLRKSAVWMVPMAVLAAVCFAATALGRKIPIIRKLI